MILKISALGTNTFSLTFQTKNEKQTKDPKYLFRKPTQDKMNVLILYAMSLKKTRITCENLEQCIIVFSIHSCVRMKAIFKNLLFNIAVSCKRNSHTTPSNDLVANTCMHVFKLYTESMQQWVDILDCRCKAAACKPWAVTSP